MWYFSISFWYLSLILHPQIINETTNMKWFFTSLVITTCALIGYAQQPIGTLNVKPFVGATLTRLHPITDNKMKMNAGVVAGAELEYQLLDKASVIAGVQFLTQGA